MNTLMRIVSAAAVLGTALFLSGCVSDTRTSRVKVVEEFSVVESSTEKELTPAQIADLRQAVANYLRAEGLTDGRTYYVRVTFPSDTPGEEPQWAVVRIGGQSTRTYTVIAAYPGRDDYYPDDFYSAGYSYANYYPGYGGFSRWGYYDPFDYNFGYYHRPTPRDRDHAKPDNPKKPDDPTDQPRHQPGPRNRWDNPPAKDDDRLRGNLPRRQPDPNRWTRERSDARDGQSRLTPRPERTSTPPERSPALSPERSYSPPPERSYSPTPPPPPDNNNSRPEPARSNPQSSREQER
jgi:hypothetical protein